MDELTIIYQSDSGLIPIMINNINSSLFGVMFPLLTIQLIRKFYVME